MNVAKLLEKRRCNGLNLRDFATRWKCGAELTNRASSIIKVCRESQDSQLFTEQPALTSL